MSSPPHDQDVPSRIDLRVAGDAAEWAASADHKRPWRPQLRRAIADLLRLATPPARRILEVGPGPGLLAKEVLSSCQIDSYTLLDFSAPMLDMCRARIGEHTAVNYVLGDFTSPDWTQALAPPYDAVVAMQAVHEIRHKRHVRNLYRQIAELLRPAGMLVICDHMPPDDSARMTALHSTVAEQHAALAAAGFAQITTHISLHGLYLCSGMR